MIETTLLLGENQITIQPQAAFISVPAPIVHVNK